MKVAIRRVSLRSLGEVGCLLGIAAAFLPSLLCGLAAIGVLRVAVRWLGSWQDLTLPLLGQEIARIDLVQFLGLERVLSVTQTATAVSWAVLFLATLSLSLLIGALLAIIVALVGLVYNLLASATGGLIVELSPEPNASPKSPPKKLLAADD